jgi:hypothetical protein
LFWKWMADSVYSTSSAYHAFFHGLLRFPCGKLIWKAWAPGKCRLHVWLLLHQNLWTAASGMHFRAMLSVRSATRPLRADHLAVGCPFAHEVWSEFLSQCDLRGLMMTLSKCVTLLGLQVQSVVARESYPQG